MCEPKKSLSVAISQNFLLLLSSIINNMTL